MKHVPFLLAAVAMLLGLQAASAQTISLAAMPGSQSVPGGGSFTVSLTVTVPQGSGPSDVAGFDLYLVTAAANSGYFSITAATPTGPFTDNGPDDSNGDPLANPATDNSGTSTGYVQNGIDQLFTGADQTVPVTNLPLERLTLSVAADTPPNTYSFQTTTMSTAGVDYSDVTDMNGTAYEAKSPGTFSITVVPEPATWAMLLGGIGILVGSRYSHTIATRRRLP